MSSSTIVQAAGREVTITNPDKLIFESIGLTKLDLVHYYLTVAAGALRGVEGRPMVLKRFVKGIDQEAVWQSEHRAAGRTGSRWPNCTTGPGYRRRRSSSAMPPRWPGWSTWVVST